MSGPVWRFESGMEATCAACYRTVTGVFTEGQVEDNDFRIERRVCPDCYLRINRLLVHGELGRHADAPAYARR